MPNVKPTKLTTSAPGDSALSLCDGFAMFPWLGTVRAKTDVDDEQGTFFDKTLNFEIFRIEMAATHTAFIGVCGPSYAVEIDTLAKTSYEVPPVGQPSSGTLAIGEHAIRGGFQAGIDFQIAIVIEVEANLIFTKKRLVSVDADIDIDVIQLLFELLLKLLEGGGGGEAEGDPNDYELSTFNRDEGTWEAAEGHPAGESPGGKGGGGVRGKFTGSGMVDFVNEPWLPPPNKTFDEPPKVTLEPSLGFNFSIVPLFAEIPFLDIIYGFDEALHAIWGSFGFGPGLHVGLPTTVTLKGATISNHPFDVTESRAIAGSGPEASFTLAERTPIDPDLQPLTETPDEIGALLEHEVGLAIGLFFFVEITFFKVIHIGAQTGNLPLFYSGRLPDGAGGPFENHLSFIPGGGPVPFAAPTTTPKVSRYTANQPQGRWRNGVLARYGVSYFDSNYETPIGGFSSYDPQARFFAFGELTDIPTGPGKVEGRNVYREFNDGSPVELVGTIDDNTTTTFTDTKA